MLASRVPSSRVPAGENLLRQDDGGAGGRDLTVAATCTAYACAADKSGYRAGSPTDVAGALRSRWTLVAIVQILSSGIANGAI